MTIENKCAKHYHVKKGDLVEVISGSWKSNSGKIVAILKKKDRVVLEMEGLSDAAKARIGKRTVKKSAANPKGGLVDRSVSVHVSNVRKKS
ncbi:MAG: 50S ribosomal protein L24 [Lentisphaeria bacterium]|nr:50S ribosomal protein L24 [Lentisphaeria bacterium]